MIRFTISAPGGARGALSALALLATAACGGNTVGEDALAGAGPAGGAVTLWTDSTELFMEHPALIVGERGVFAVHLTDVTDYAPIRSGPITLRFRPRDGGAPLEVVQEVPRAPGIYGPAPIFTRAGTYDLTILVKSPQAIDSISVPGLLVYASAADAPREDEAESGGIGFLKEQQWKTPGFRTDAVATGVVAASYEVTGEVVPAAGRLAVVSAPVPGIVEVAGVLDAPAPGAGVRAGQVLARLRPTLGESGASVAEARARMREAEEEHARAVRLLAAQAVPARRVREAEIRLQAAREALGGLGGGDLTHDGQLEITAPFAGVVTARRMIPGSLVAAGTPLFTIIDPSVVWVTARVPAGRASAVSLGAGAAFRVEGASRLYRTDRAVSAGSVIDSVTRTVTVIYEVRNADRSLRIGALASVMLQTGARMEGAVVPSGAILDEDGRSIVYVQLGGESFERREVQLGGSANGRTLVRSGLRVGERVVSGAPYQIRLASLSTSVPAEGHAH